MSVSHQGQRIGKKSLAADKRNAQLGSISQDAGDPGNFSGLAGNSTHQSALRKHAVASQSNSKLTSFHSNQVTAQRSRESSFKQKRVDRMEQQQVGAANRARNPGVAGMSSHDDEDQPH